jgi:hypothetical protein
MEMTLHFHFAAQAENIAAMAWHEQQRAGLVLGNHERTANVKVHHGTGSSLKIF